MDVAVSNLVNVAVQMQQANVEHEKQAMILKKALDAHSSATLQLLQAVAPSPALATEGVQGTQINTYA